MTQNTTNLLPADATDEGTRFVPGYERTERRIWRSRIRLRGDGTATVTFRGDLDDATTDCWIEQGTSGRLSLYADVTPTDDTATEIKVAVVPTGKRVPQTADGYRAFRIGSVKGSHVYLLSVDGTVDRAAYDAERAQRRAAREAQRQALLAATYGDDDEYDDAED